MLARRIFTLLTVVPLTACMSQHVITTPGPYIDQHLPDQATITRTDGTQSILMAPKIFHDTIMAFVLGAGNPEQVQVPLPQVQSITVKTVDKPRTWALALGAAAAVIGTAATLSGHGPAPNPSCNGKQVVNQTVSCRAKPPVAIPALKLYHAFAHAIEVVAGGN